MFVYPTTDLDRWARLVGSLGTFWSQTYNGVDQIEHLAFARTQSEKQTEQDWQELKACVSRETLPIFHTELWYPLVLRESELNATNAAALRYGVGDARYGGQAGQPPHRYGVPSVQPYFTFPCPAEVVAAPLVFNRIADPSLTWLRGLDYEIHPEYASIVFKTNPFEDGLVPVRDTVTEDGAADREALLWLYHASTDRQHVYYHAGAPLGVFSPSSRPYRQFLVAVWNALVEGSSVQWLQQAAAAAMDISLAEGTETVEAVWSDTNYLFIVTDQRAYRFRSAATPLVAVGDTVHAGQSLTDAIRFYDFNRGQFPADLRALQLGKGFLSPGFQDGVTFYNRDVAIVVNTEGTFTEASFELGGWPEDVDYFWEQTQARGIARAQTLAHLLDRRTSPTGEPTAASLPATINPMQFAVENILRNNAYACRVRTSCRGEDALSPAVLRALRRITPPHTALLLIFELEADNDTVSPEAAGTSTVAGCSETTTSFVGSEPFSESLDPATMLQEGVAARYVDGLCL